MFESAGVVCFRCEMGVGGVDCASCKRNVCSPGLWLVVLSENGLRSSNVICDRVVSSCLDETTTKGHEIVQSCNANHILNQLQTTDIIHTPCYIKKGKSGT